MIAPGGVQQILDAIRDEHMDRLNDWERSFVESVADQFDRYGRLSEAQCDKLEEIWVRLP